MDMQGYTFLPAQNVPVAYGEAIENLPNPSNLNWGSAGLAAFYIPNNSYLIATTSAIFTAMDVTPETATVDSSQSVTLQAKQIPNSDIWWFYEGKNGSLPQGMLTASGNSATYTAPAIVVPDSGSSTATELICAHDNGNAGYNVYCAEITVMPCAMPTIAAVTPDTWFAGKSYKTTITGTGFIPADQATASCPESPLTITAATGTAATANASIASAARVATAATASTALATPATATSTGGVTVTDIKVVSPTEITATVKPAANDTTETAQVTVGTAPYIAASTAQITNLPPPIIQRYGKTISGKTTNVTVGQPVELTSEPDPKDMWPVGYKITKSTWTVGGTNIGAYDGSDEGITLTPTVLNDTKTTFYWLYASNGLKVTYTYCATGPDGVEVCPPSTTVSATFNAKGGGNSISMDVGGFDNATIQNLDTCTSGSKNKSGTTPYLEYGDRTGPAPTCINAQNQIGPWGITLTAKGAESGKYVFAQYVVSDAETYTTFSGSNNVCGPNSGLDRDYPYPAVQTPSEAVDVLEMPLLPNNYATGTRSFDAKMYLLWKPNQLDGATAPSIPVPIGYQEWIFDGNATCVQSGAKCNWKDAKMTSPHNANKTPSAFIYSTASDNALYGYPQWENRVRTSCTF
jgi:hypothetical protein